MRRAGETAAGYSVNVPLAPYTGDEVWLEAFDAVVPPLLGSFEPDLVFTQLGIDTHFRDPITHLRLTTQGHNEAVRRLGELAAKSGRWVAVGGGGYDPGAVARAWTMDLATMAGFELPERIPESFDSIPVPATFADDNPPDLGPLSSIRRGHSRPKAFGKSGRTSFLRMGFK